MKKKQYDDVWAQAESELVAIYAKAGLNRNDIRKSEIEARAMAIRNSRSRK